jgi:hypothetical protein
MGTIRRNPPQRPKKLIKRILKIPNKAKFSLITDVVKQYRDTSGKLIQNNVNPYSCLKIKTENL